MNALTHPLPARVHAQPGYRLPEGKVTTLAGYDLIALGATKPLIRPHEPALQQRRHNLLKRALADNARATRSVVALLGLSAPTLAVLQHTKYANFQGQWTEQKNDPWQNYTKLDIRQTNSQIYGSWEIRNRQHSSYGLLKGTVKKDRAKILTCQKNGLPGTQDECPEYRKTYQYLIKTELSLHWNYSDGTALANLTRTPP